MSCRNKASSRALRPPCVFQNQVQISRLHPKSSTRSPGSPNDSRLKSINSSSALSSGVQLQQRTPHFFQNQTQNSYFCILEPSCSFLQILKKLFSRIQQYFQGFLYNLAEQDLQLAFDFSKNHFFLQPNPELLPSSGTKPRTLTFLEPRNILAPSLDLELEMSPSQPSVHLHGREIQIQFSSVDVSFTLTFEFFISVSSIMTNKTEDRTSDQLCAKDALFQLCLCLHEGLLTRPPSAYFCPFIGCWSPLR